MGGGGSTADADANHHSPANPSTPRSRPTLRANNRRRGIHHADTDTGERASRPNPQHHEPFRGDSDAAEITLSCTNKRIGLLSSCASRRVAYRRRGIPRADTNTSGRTLQPGPQHHEP
ncbi:hypothetical protein P171DRAFT_442710 [Karstenula rhodostoma CBS 690.94]|uniref:Uncharacterized protein n=1 Tax=Karstenula rhodostoma CBS 690.94 TaxID=1392251 RepID=A0A9P4PLT3_9PLEO|nr:hypothetical protein P171DRAFT_442710 [Karstenula rhodostoma CBS 690.94]